MIPLERLCNVCKHRRRGTHPPACAAFPVRIPLAIRMMEADHRRPYEGDGGILFEPADDSPETKAYVARMEIRRKRTSDATPLWDVLSDAQREEFLKAGGQPSQWSPQDCE